MSTSDDQDRTRIQPPRAPRAGKATPTDANPGPETTLKSNPKSPAQPAVKPASQRDSDLTLSSPRSESAKVSAPKELLKNRFVLEKVLGAGGMGVVYKAKDLLKVEAQDRDPYVAIKVLGEEFKSHPEAFIALQRESRKTQRIAHPNIVNVHDFDKDGDTVFMTMEYLEGTPVDKLIKQYRKAGGLPPAEVWPILEGLCAALEYAHAQHIVHADLKPGNIFVTQQGVTKVFDFGIARAVAKAELDSGDAEDRTVFDASSFGALTPAYASPEMLEGGTPDVRDDIYALGCITYELLTGTHPFQRKNASEALRLGLKPERIESLSKHQWRVVEQTLSFERENRTPSVRAFWAALNHKRRHPVTALIALTLVLVAAVAGGWLYLDRNRPVAAQQINADEFRSEIETQIRSELVQNSIRNLLQAELFDEAWEYAIWLEIQSLEKLLGSSHEGYREARAATYQIYRTHIQAQIEAQQYPAVLGLIERARRYTDDPTELESFAVATTAAIAEAERLHQAQLEQQRLARQNQQEQQQKQQVQVEKQQQDEHRRTAYESALSTVKAQLHCSQMLDMGDFAIAVKQLRTLDPDQYKKAEGGIVQELAACLQKIGRNFPDRALAARTAALELFPQNARLAALEIAPLDNCTQALAGFGARGKRSQCQDALGGGGKSPETVVIPGSGGIAPFAIGRYEVRVGEINQYCDASKACKALPGSAAMPATGLSAQLVQAYLRWLSEASGKTYRLPTLAEWQLAARANGRSLDANRNCRLNSRGIQKGGSLLNAQIGQQNGWGLVNYVGNAREWVQGSGGLLVVGGSYATEMEECIIEWQQPSDGNPDSETGFRVVRELPLS
jgi:serine/threonine protein kinase